ncbi:hypothetical protein [uncultured Amnibacterium sp.]|uniref:hypothetical protein n=1 Tax=uncultured Amnibacterium sp. TaxID=1631851 RepID=UPI0035CA8C6C
MSTTTARDGFRASTVAGVAVRAVIAAALAAVVTFTPDHTARTGLVVLGVYLLVQAAVLGGGAAALARTRAGRGLVAARAAVSLVGGVVALTGVASGLDLLRPLEALVFGLVGALEIVGGLLGGERSELAGDAVVVGGLQVLVGVLLVVLNPDALFAVGVLSAWGAVVAVYLGISAANLRRRSARR